MPMGAVQQLIAFVVFVVRSIGDLIQSLAPGGARRRQAHAPFVLAEAPEGGAMPGGTAPVVAPPTAPTVEPLHPPTRAEVEAVIHHLPRPTIWPALIAFGTTLLGFGVMSSLTFAICGAVLLLIGVGGWIVELRHA